MMKTKVVGKASEDRATFEMKLKLHIIVSDLEELRALIRSLLVIKKKKIERKL